MLSILRNTDKQLNTTLEKKFINDVLKKKVYSTTEYIELVTKEIEEYKENNLETYEQFESELNTLDIEILESQINNMIEI